MDKPKQNIQLDELVSSISGVYAYPHRIIKDYIIDPAIKYVTDKSLNTTFKSSQLPQNFGTFLSFENCIFNVKIDFEHINLINGISFNNCKFNETVSIACKSKFFIFDTITFKKTTLFNSEFENPCLFRNINFESRFIFSTDSIINKKLDFASCKFNDLASFNNLNFGEQVVYRNCDLTNCSFLHSNIQNVSFIDNEFEGNILIDEINLKQYHDGTIPSLYSYKNVLSVYKNFEISLDRSKNFEQAGEFHKRAFDLQRKYELSRFKKLIITFYKLFSNYGEDYPRSLLWILGILVFFSFVYLFTGIKYNDFVIYYGNTDNIYRFFNDWGCALLYSLNSSVPFRRELEFIKSANGWTTFFSIFQTLLQTIIGTLFIVALRRKFRR